jgi:chemotaxis protein CheZ
MTETVMADNESVIEIARQLVDELEDGNEALASEYLDILARKREQGLFREIGKITRKLHNSLRELRFDTRLVDQAETAIPEARERLNYVVTLTEQAADKTLTAVEISLPLIDTLKTQAESFSDQIKHFKNKQNSGNINALITEAEQFCQLTTNHSLTLRSQLSTIMMAQDFQDLTGQVIGQVINIAQEIEESLVGLIRISGQHISGDLQTSATITDEANTQANGPQVPGLEDSEVVKNQDDVDDLLSSLGF